MRPYVPSLVLCWGVVVANAFFAGVVVSEGGSLLWFASPILLAAFGGICTALTYGYTRD